MNAARQFDVIVLGAGAAGLMCAATAGQRGRRVALLEHGGQSGRKILISGGGRCNFTNIHCAPANFLSENPHFAKSALAGYRPKDFLALVERYRIPWHEKTLGQLFCDGSARAILDMLLAECDRATEHGGSVELILNACGIQIEKDPSGRLLRLLLRRRNASGRSGSSHRRPVHPEDGRNRPRLRNRQAVRPQSD